jgi:hypothetical protein
VTGAAGSDGACISVAGIPGAIGAGGVPAGGVADGLALAAGVGFFCFPIPRPALDSTGEPVAGRQLGRGYSGRRGKAAILSSQEGRGPLSRAPTNWSCHKW